MSTITSDDMPVLGTLCERDGKGVVRLERRFHMEPVDLWSALTDRSRLASWLGEIDGELQAGCELWARYFASGWEGSVRVERCEPPHRLLLTTSSPDEPAGAVEVTLTPEGDTTVLVVEDRGVPLQWIAAYGAGDHIHVEDLASYLAGHGRCDARVRWAELHPAYQRLAADID